MEDSLIIDIGKEDWYSTENDSDWNARVLYNDCCVDRQLNPTDAKFVQMNIVGLLGSTRAEWNASKESDAAVNKYCLTISYLCKTLVSLHQTNPMDVYNENWYDGTEDFIESPDKCVRSAKSAFLQLREIVINYAVRHLGRDFYGDKNYIPDLSYDCALAMLVLGVYDRSKMTKLQFKSQHDVVLKTLHALMTYTKGDAYIANFVLALYSDPEMKKFLIFDKAELLTLMRSIKGGIEEYQPLAVLAVDEWMHCSEDSKPHIVRTTVMEYIPLPFYSIFGCCDRYNDFRQPPDPTSAKVVPDDDECYEKDM